MRYLFYLSFFFCVFSVGAQRRDNSFVRIDNWVKSIDADNLDSLATKLIELGSTDLQKVRAIFRWITEHIDYNVRIYNRSKVYPGLKYEESDDSLLPLPSLNERVAAKVLAKRVAFCDGYSRFFKVLCDRAGIPCEIVYGYARTNAGRNGRFGINHIWNSVYLEGSWHLLDVTWASGFLTYANEFVRSYNDNYFLASPDEFIRDHYPADPRWSLLQDPPIYREFNQMPFRYGGFVKAGITSFSPAIGVIDAALGDTIRFELISSRELRSVRLFENLVADSTIDEGWLEKPAQIQPLKIQFPVTTTNNGWLYIYCNDEPVLRYRLNIKKDVVKKD